jgi:hypothetical protein
MNDSILICPVFLDVKLLARAGRVWRIAVIPLYQSNTDKTCKWSEKQAYEKEGQHIA